MSEQHGYKVIINQTTDRDEYVKHSNEAYDYSWSKSCSNALQMVSVEDNYPDVVSTVAPQDVAYIVWAEWSTGDSFGHGYCTEAEAFGVFNCHDSAKELAKELRRIAKEDIEELDFTTQDGQEFKQGWVAFAGYFEKLENVYVEPVTVGSAKEKY